MHIMVIRGGLGNIIYQIEYASSLEGLVFLDLSWYRRYKSDSWHDYIKIFGKPNIQGISNRYLVKICKILGNRYRVSTIDNIYRLGKLRVHEGYWQQSDDLYVHRSLMNLQRQQFSALNENVCCFHIRVGDFYQSSSHEVVDVESIKLQLQHLELRSMSRYLVTNDSKSNLVLEIKNEYDIEDISTSSVSDWWFIFKSSIAIGSKQSTFFKTAAILGGAEAYYYED